LGREEEKIKKETSKRKNWTAPGIDGIQNYWWKKFTMAQKALVRIYTNLHRDTSGIPEWWPSIQGELYFYPRQGS